MDLTTKALAAPFRIGSAIRGARVFHPRGVLFEGTAHLESDWWPAEATAGPVPIQARLSRGVGTPQSLPDILGLAVRLHLPGGPWDLLMATTYLPIRVLPVPARTWASGRYSTLMAYRRDAGAAPRWIIATPRGAQPRGDAALDALAAPLSFSLDLVAARGSSTAGGRLDLDGRIAVDDRAQPDFDPVVHRAPDVRLWPAWLATTRRAAYAGSRAGRNASRSSAPEGQTSV